MTAFTFEHGPDLPAEAAWRPLDRALWRWTRAHGGSPLLARLAAWAAFADGEGDAALPLAGEEAMRYGLAPLDDARLDTLRGEPLLGDGRVHLRSSAVAGAGRGIRPCAPRTQPRPVGTGLDSNRSTPSRSSATAEPRISTIESTAPTS